RVVEHDVGGNLVRFRPLEPPALQRLEAGPAVHGRDRLACNPVADLSQEPARLGVPSEEDVAAGAGDADVEEAPFLVLVAPTNRQLALLDARDEDRVELEPLRAVQREQMDAAARTRAEALVQRRSEVAAAPLERRR